MIIDFHTHIFPEKIAERTMKSLIAASNYPHFTDGTAKGLYKSMQEAKVDYSVNLPILTNPESFYRTLDHLLTERKAFDKIISFAAIHPRCEDIPDKIAVIKQAGFIGIKLHPLFQNEPIDSEKSEFLIDLAAKAGLLIMIHPGFDISFPECKHAEPKKIVRMLEDVKPKGVILAHMGALEYWEEVEDTVCGRDVYFDTSFSTHLLGEKNFVRLVKKHGVEKILFGTDSPWCDQKSYVELINSFSSLTSEEKQMILYKNGAKLLKIEV